MNPEYEFSDIIDTAQGLRAYLSVEPGGMPFLGKTHSGLAAELIGVSRFQDWRGKRLWTLQQATLEHRLRSAGIDPVTWKIVDQRRAAFAWQQLRTGKHKYSPTRQELLVSDLNNPTPDINEKLIFSTQRDNLTSKEEKPLDKGIKHQIINYLRDKGNI